MEHIIIECPECEARLRMRFRVGRTHVICPSCGVQLELPPLSPTESSDSTPDVSLPLPREAETADEEEAIRSSRRPFGLVGAFLLSLAVGLGGLLYLIKYQTEQQLKEPEYTPLTQATLISGQDIEVSDAEIAKRLRLGMPISFSGTTINGGPLRYKWETDPVHYYSLHLSVDGGKLNIGGQVTYRVYGQAQDPREQQSGSGTGFVVSPDGYVATCLHVVDGAGKIDVILGERKWKAKVIAQDSATDLALLKIEATDLPVCRLSQSQQPQLAETVRAFGYPLSSLLGSELKVTTGTIAGVAQLTGGEQRIQTDAPINPGNSGGPLIDPFGNVVGIASSRLSGVGEVGLAVPVAELQPLIKAVRCECAYGDRKTPMNGPEVAQMITPSVALIQVTGVRDDSAVRVAYTGNLNGQVSGSKPDIQQALLLMSLRRPFRGQAIVGSWGELLSDPDMENVLPFGLGHVAEVPVYALDRHGRTAWSSVKSELLQIQKAARGHPLQMLFGGASRQEPSVQLIPAERSVSYMVVDDSNPSRIRIRRDSQLITNDSETAPFLNIQSTGEIQFDREAGMPSEVTLHYTFEQNSEGKKTTFPVRLVVKKLHFNSTVSRRTTTQPATKPAEAHSPANKPPK